MLNKNVCQKCWKNYRIKNEFDGSWNIVDEDDWKNDFVFCSNTLDFIKTNRKPPTRCPYILEHLMESQNKC